MLIVVDTLRRDHVSAYGGPPLTPRIDALAARGRVFQDVRAAFHQTTMSMGSLFTGRTPSLETADPARSLRWNGETWCGMARFATDSLEGVCLPPALPTLGERMQQAGYWTMGIASNQFLFGEAGFSRGFDDWIEVGSPDRPFDRPKEERGKLSELRSWGPVTDAAIGAFARRPRDRFFMFVHFMDVHDYHYAKVDYRGAVGVIDAAVGRLLDSLDSEGLLEGATVVLTSDHGERLGETHRPRGRPSHYGNPSFEEVLEIPLIVAPARDGESIPLRRTTDLHHMLEHIAGLRPEREKLLESGEHFVSERFFRTYIRGNWKSTIRRRDGRLFLFDLATDPDEQRDVAADHPDVAEAHRRRVDDLTRELAVPTLRADRELSDAERRTLEALGYVE